MTPQHVAVIDIGKTNAKLALVDRSTLSEIAVVTRPNTVLPGPPWPHFDVEGHWAFLLDGLAEFHRAHRIDAISITTHGACAVLLDQDGRLAAPVLDYEHDGPDEMAAAYDGLRPDFADTGSPRLPGGLNVGAQLHWQFATDPGLKARTAMIVTYPQYWGFRLTGVAATDVSSLGCHTDLWLPRDARLSALADRLEIADRIAPPHAPGDVLGPILPAIAARTGLEPGTPVLCGIHDSNASLLPHLLTRKAPFSVVSTGTWVVCLSVGAEPVALDPALDTLINVDAFGQPVPSARFMGGREHDLAAGRDAATPTDADVLAALRERLQLLPAVVPGSGPFAGRESRWVPDAPAPGSGLCSAAVAFYLALVTARCLSLTGHRGDIVVEGPFARNRPYLQMLAAATGCGVFAAGSVTGTSQGAALLAGGEMPAAALQQADRHSGLPEMTAYARDWQARTA